MKNTTKNIMKVLSVIAPTTAIASFAFYATTKCLVNIAIDREVPKTMKSVGKLISGSKPDEGSVSKCKEAAQKLMGRENETVKIVARDGTTLIGHWIPRGNAKRIIIAMHGWRSTWYKDFGMISDFWENNDCSVLYAEQRGQNNSGGDYMGFGLIERYDCLDWINWVTNRCGGELPIYLSGVSMGATTVLMASGFALPSNVHGIIGDCGFTSPYAIWKHVANKNLHIAFGIRGTVADALCKKKIQIGANDYSTIDALQTCSVPIILIHGTDDHFVPIEMTYENYKACHSPKKLFVVPGADHGMSYDVDQDGYEAVIQDFWRQFD